MSATAMMLGIVSCNENTLESENNPTIHVVNKTSVAIDVACIRVEGVVVGGPSDAKYFTVGPNSTDFAFVDYSGKKYKIEITPKGGAPITIFHTFGVNEDWTYTYDGVIGGPGGAGDLT